MKDWHSLKIDECIKLLKSDKQGLTNKQAEKNLKKYGQNELPKQKILAGYKIFFSQFKNSLIYILLFTGVLSIAVKAYKEAIVIFGAVIINVIIGFFQENKANQAIVKLRELIEHKAYVLRDGNEISIESSHLTLGDIIVIKAGNRLPADARIIESSDLLVDESMLTGESVPAHKTIECAPKGAALADRNSMVFAGTVVVSGLGKAIVTNIGKSTEVGKIADMVESTKEEETPLQLRLAQFSRFLAIVFSVICVLIVVIGLWQGRPFVEILETGVAVGVASIPEGLIVAVTFILALGMQRILKERALTRKLVAVETLGSTTVICSDKTGTLTEGKMDVAHIIIGENEYELETMGSRQDPLEAKIVSLALQISMMCNDALVENPDDELSSWRFIGTPTEIALLKAAIQAGLNREKLFEKEPKVTELPFTSEKKFMLSLHKTDTNKYKLYEKGAPEILLSKSTKFYHKGKLQTLEKHDRDKLKTAYENLTSRGLRVIGIAEKNHHLTPNSTELNSENIDWTEIDNDLTFVGFIALKDPLRREAADTIKTATEAGLRTVIITGDHKLTAKAIAQEVGLKVKAENIIMGEELDNINDDKLKDLVKTVNVYARVSPHHKLRIVKALQECGEVVAMTGDGINDSPALKVADIGISLGTGTDIAKETSDIVLLDNNFKTIISAVKQGRIIFKNIRKVIIYLISDSFSEILLVVGSIVFNTPLAILPAQILWINIVNDSMPHFSLAFERDHGEVMKEKPIAKNESLINPRMKTIIFGVGIFRDIILFFLFYYFYKKWQLEPERMKYLTTFIFVTLGLKSLLSIFSFRSFGRQIWRYNPLSNKYLLLAVSASLSLLITSVYWPPLRDLLGNSEKVDYRIWLGAILFSVFNLMLLEIVKGIYVLKTKKPPQKI